MPPRVALAALVLLIGASQVEAQVPDSVPSAIPAPPPPVPAIKLWHIGAALGGVAAISLLDEDIQTWMVNHRGQGDRRLAFDLEYLGRPDVQGFTALGIAVVGVVADRPGMVRHGARIAVAGVVAGGILRLSKHTIGRARPSAGLGAFDFDTFSDQSAFPSGHAGIAWAFTTTLADAIEVPAIDIGLYTLATGSSIARVVNNRHWVSDIVAGALVGHTVAKVVDGRWRVFNLRPPELLLGPTGTGLRWQVDLPALRSAPGRPD
jgi:membrane-associated phospholipid phosphatase